MLPLLHEYVLLVGNETKIPVTIVRDTGASESFSSSNDTGTSVLIRGIGLNVLSVPLDKIVLSSHLVNGEVVIGVYPACGVVDIITCNNLVGGMVWPDSFSLHVISTSHLLGLDESIDRQVFAACATTQSMTNIQPSFSSESAVLGPTFLVTDNLSVSPPELIQEQQLDSSLSKLFESVLSSEEIMLLIFYRMRCW